MSEVETASEIEGIRESARDRSRAWASEEVEGMKEWNQARSRPRARSRA